MQRNLLCIAQFMTICTIKRRASNKRRPLKSAGRLSINIEISASPLIIAAPLNLTLIRIANIFY